MARYYSDDPIADFDRWDRDQREREKIRAAKEQERIRSKTYKALVPYRIRGEQ